MKIFIQDQKFSEKFHSRTISFENLFNSTEFSENFYPIE